MDAMIGREVILAGIGVAAGVLGALVGIGGGIIVVPCLVLLFGVSIRVAVATSLIAVVATSTAAGSVYVGSGTANMRLGMTLEVATTLGGITGGLIAAWIAPTVLAGVFGVMMGITAALMFRGREGHAVASSSEVGARAGWEDSVHLGGGYVDERGALVAYRAERVPIGLAISLLAGVLSGMLGVGGGFLKVPAMVLGMRVPFKVAAATSNFMIGVTAASSLFVYFARGDVHPAIAAPIAVGISLGALLGTMLAHRMAPAALRRILAIILLLVGMQMVLKSFGVELGR
jgi:uncharacterized membrane protein YfcA